MEIVYLWSMQIIKPHDIVVLLKLLCRGKGGWKYESLEQELTLSKSAIFRSLNRCANAKFISSNPFQQFYIKNLSEFLIHGIQYVFVAEPGKTTRGIATAHSASPLNKVIVSEKDVYIWAYAKGNLRGQAIEPLIKHAAEIVKTDNDLYELMTLIDAIRVGKTREKQIAATILTEKLDNYAANY